MPAIGSDGIKIEAQILRFDAFLHAGAFRSRSGKNSRTKMKGGGVSPAALIVDVAVPLSAGAATRSAATGWPAPDTATDGRVKSVNLKLLRRVRIHSVFLLAMSKKAPSNGH
jgi:hypothetical protein